MTNSSTNNFFKINAIVVFCATLVMAVLSYMLSSPHGSENYTLKEICIWLVFPLFALMIALLFSKIISSILKTEESQTTGVRSFTTVIWKNLFIFSLINTVILFLLVPIFFLIHDLKTLRIYQSFEDFNGFDYLVCCVATGYFFGTLYSVATKKKKSNWALVGFLLLQGLIVSYFIAVSVSAYSDEPETEGYARAVNESEYDETRMVESGDSQTYSESEYTRYQDSIEALNYNLPFEDLSSLKTGAYFADLWENPSDDKDSTLHVLLNVFNDYIILRKEGSVGHFIDAPRDVNLLDATVKVMNKMGNDPVKLASAFKSYRAMIYYLIPEEIYKESGLKNLTELLLQTHYELYDDEKKLDEIYNIMTMPRDDDRHFGRNDYFIDLKGFFSKKIIKSVQSSANFSTYDSILSDYSKGQVVWLYTFWARRYKENNDEEVFQILNEIKEHYN
ncbi:hypothetical protein ACFSX9_10860 [Flavobacterium ardleyense]|uniref:Uncharacterized protein n=1 Tax=Flavobacterium ardleyense TaxID=2038737 RepID=A0ABW5ZA68_9FLAO